MCAVIIVVKWFFIIKYLIKNLENTYIDILVNNILIIVDEIINIIQQSYYETIGLKITFFKIEINNMLEYKINEIDKDGEPHFLLSDDEISVNGKCKCINKNNCNILMNLENYRAIFGENVTLKLREYFTDYCNNINAAADHESSLLEFEIAKYGAFEAIDIGIKEPLTILQLLEQNKVLVILVCILIISFIISIFAWIYENTAQNGSLWYAPMIFALQFVVMASDINLCIELVNHNEFVADIGIKICSVLWYYDE